MSGDLDGLGSVAGLRADGFMPIDELTGQLELALVWPEAHRRAVLDPRLEPAAADAIAGLADGVVYLVRSPWHSVSTEEAVKLLQRWQRKHRPTSNATGAVKIDRAQQLALAAEFLTQDEQWVRAYREGHVRPARQSDDA